MKAHEETWEAELHSNACECPTRIVRRDVSADDDGDLFYANDGGRAECMWGRAKLAACAPEMARLLLGLEWSVRRGLYDARECPACNALEHEGHTAGVCALDALLRKAGVR